LRGGFGDGWEQAEVVNSGALLHHAGLRQVEISPACSDEVGGSRAAALGSRVGAEQRRAAGDLRVGDKFTQGDP
jgi:hypothetical protein